MQTKLLMGNEAIAYGAIHAGVHVVTGYPGTPSTEILETVAGQNDGSIYVEWSVNEKAAMEVGAGAAYAGARVLVTMKQVGLNVASDPLMSLNYVGVKGGMVIVVADDPGPISSQTEQDTRHFGIFAKLPVFDPTSPEEAYAMMEDAFALSERFHTPVILRPTTRVCHACAPVTFKEPLSLPRPEGFIKDSKWVIFPRLAFANKQQIEQNLRALQEEQNPHNTLCGSGKRGIVASGISYAHACAALEGVDAEYKLLKLSTLPYPHPLMQSFLEGLEEVLVLEELDPVMERALLAVCGETGLRVKLRGKTSGDLPNAGEYSIDLVARAVRTFLQLPQESALPLPEPPALPVRPPVLCAGCPHRASFYAVKEATKKRQAVFSGDIGCYTLGNSQPLDMVDTCLCMGAGITIAQGLQRVQPDVLHFAFIGDSTFFHTGIAGIVNAVYNQTDIIIVVLDNSITAMTGGQPHPGTGQTMMHTQSSKLDIEALVRALGVDAFCRVNPFDLQQAIQKTQEVAEMRGVRVLLFEAPCIMLEKNSKTCTIGAACTQCKQCIKKLGCPALSYDGDTVRIDSELCTGCGACAFVCPFDAIGGAQK